MSKIMATMGLSLLLSFTACAESTSKISDDNHQLHGDVGLALYRTPSITRASGGANVLLPYMFADYGHFFARVDTFGVKLLPLGAGSLELSARVSFEGYKPVGIPRIKDRRTPLPVGLSTFQETPYGAFFAYGFFDPQSGGTLLDAMYVAEFKIGGVNIYPQLGVERRSAKYVQKLYGVSAQENVASGYSIATYSPGNSISPNFGLAFEYPLNNDYNLTLQVRKKWFDNSITDSPLVTRKSQMSSFISLTRSFK